MPRWRSSTPAARPPRPSGGGGTRCCSGSSGCSTPSRSQLADGAELTEHQVDVLSGTLAALTAEIEDSVAAESWNGAGALPGPTATATAAAPAAAELDGRRRERAAEEVAEEDETLAPDEEPQDWEEPTEDLVDEAPEDPGRAGAFGSSTRPAPARRSPRSVRGGVANRRRPDPDPPAQPRRPVHRRDLRPWLQGPALAAAHGRLGPSLRPGDRRDLPVVRAQRRAASPTPTRS